MNCTRLLREALREACRHWRSALCRLRLRRPGLVRRQLRPPDSERPCRPRPLARRLVRPQGSLRRRVLPLASIQLLLPEREQLARRLLRRTAWDLSRR